MIHAKDVHSKMGMDDVMEAGDHSGFCIHNNRDVLLCGLNSTFAVDILCAVAEERNAVSVIHDALDMIPIIEKKAKQKIKTFKVTDDYTTRFGYSTNQMGPLLQTKNKLSLLQNNARGGPLQVRVEKNISHGSSGNLLMSRADLRMSMVTKAAKVSSILLSGKKLNVLESRPIRNGITLSLEHHLCLMPLC